MKGLEKGTGGSDDTQNRDVWSKLQPTSFRIHLSIYDISSL